MNFFFQHYKTFPRYSINDLSHVLRLNSLIVPGLFASEHLEYDLLRKQQSGNNQPTLAEMTRKAIEILKRNPKGFTLLVEGGRIGKLTKVVQNRLV